MTARKTTSTDGAAFYRVRVVIPGALLHLASATEPAVGTLDGRRHVEADWLEDPEAGDTVGFINWDEVAAVTWRYSAPTSTEVRHG